MVTYIPPRAHHPRSRGRASRPTGPCLLYTALAYPSHFTVEKEIDSDPVTAFNELTIAIDTNVKNGAVSDSVKAASGTGYWELRTASAQPSHASHPTLPYLTWVTCVPCPTQLLSQPSYHHSILTPPPPLLTHNTPTRTPTTPTRTHTYASHHSRERS